LETLKTSTGGFVSKPDEKILKALSNLEDNADFNIVLGWILASSGDIDNILRNAESEKMLYRAQGASRVVMAIAGYADDPRGVLATMLRHRKGLVFPDEGAAAMPPLNIDSA